MLDLREDGQMINKSILKYVMEGMCDGVRCSLKYATAKHKLQI